MAGGAGMILYGDSDDRQPAHRHPLGAVGPRRQHARAGDQGLHRVVAQPPCRDRARGENETWKHAPTMALLLVARRRPGGRGHHQARRHRARRADPRRQLAVPRARRRAGRAVPGDRRHVDVEPARRRSVRAAQAGAPGLDAGDGEVGADDDAPTRTCSTTTGSAPPIRSTWVPATSTRARSHEKGSTFDPGLVYDAGFFEYLGFLCDAEASALSAAARCPFLEADRRSDRRQRPQPRRRSASRELAGSQTVTRTVTSVADTAGEVAGQGRCARPATT